MTESKAPDVAQFFSVDTQNRAAQFLEFMDAMRKWPSMIEQKADSVAQLRLRPGSSALDVGCGTGEDVAAMARACGIDGNAVGVDASELMVAEAEKRHAGGPWPLRFEQGRADELPFEGDSFDGIRSERLLEHLDNPNSVLAEMMRVSKPGGRLCLISTDGDSYMFDFPDRDLARKVLHHTCDRRRGGWMGRRLIGLAASAGITDLSVRAFAHVRTDPDEVASELERKAELCLGDGAITESERGLFAAHASELRSRVAAIFLTTHIMVAGTVTK